MALVQLNGFSGFLILLGVAGSVILTFVLAALATRSAEGWVRSAPLVLAFCALGANGVGQFLAAEWILESVLPLQALSLATSVLLLVRQRLSAKT